MYLFTRIKNNYKIQLSAIVEYGLKLNHQKTAFAIASALCIGVTPLFGFTFFIAVAFGFIFKLNQFIMASVHVLVTPLQIILFYPYVKAGQYIFHIESKVSLPINQLPDFILHNSGEFIRDYLKIMIATTSIWIILSIGLGYILYRIILGFFTRIVVSS